jgi:hypothetical protein
MRLENDKKTSKSIENIYLTYFRQDGHIGLELVANFIFFPGSGAGVKDSFLGIIVDSFTISCKIS